MCSSGAYARSTLNCPYSTRIIAELTSVINVTFIEWTKLPRLEQGYGYYRFHVLENRYLFFTLNTFTHTYSGSCSLLYCNYVIRSEVTTYDPWFFPFPVTVWLLASVSYIIYVTMSHISGICNNARRVKVKNFLLVVSPPMVYLSMVYSTYMTMDILDFLNFKEFTSLQDMLESSYQIWFQKPGQNQTSHFGQLKADLVLQKLEKYANVSLYEMNRTYVEKDIFHELSPQTPLRAILFITDHFEAYTSYVENVVLKGKYKCYVLKHVILPYTKFDHVLANIYMPIDTVMKAMNEAGFRQIWTSWEKHAHVLEIAKYSSCVNKTAPSSFISMRNLSSFYILFLFLCVGCVLMYFLEIFYYLKSVHFRTCLKRAALNFRERLERVALNFSECLKKVASQFGGCLKRVILNFRLCLKIARLILLRIRTSIHDAVGMPR